ncbi:MAG: hypothetical protein LBJ94_01175 [Puniceicoccales bacterium]|jgi:hypothetical protein|nr:hypothetical protein [Puniceicoccales bacterium]
MNKENVSEGVSGTQSEEQSPYCWKEGQVMPLTAEEKAEHMRREADWEHAPSALVTLS